MSGLHTGIGYEDFPPTDSTGSGDATFHDINVPTAPGEPKTLFVVIGIAPEA